MLPLCDPIWHAGSRSGVVFLVLTTRLLHLAIPFVGFLCRSLQCDRNTIHKNLVLCLLTAEFIFIIGIIQYDKPVRDDRYRSIVLARLRPCVPFSTHHHHHHHRTFVVCLLHTMSKNIGT